LSCQLTPVVRPVYVRAVGTAVVACFIPVGEGLLEPDLGVGGDGCGGEEMLDVFDQSVCGACCDKGAKEEGG
jgi:hypothetical protein